jgi:hypothetical protein
VLRRDETVQMGNRWWNINRLSVWGAFRYSGQAIF